jgi:predicted HD phosphohydrolase
MLRATAPGRHEPHSSIRGPSRRAQDPTCRVSQGGPGYGLTMTDQPLETVLASFYSRGATTYGGETVTVTDHSLQTAGLADMAGKSESLIAACLLHDVGWLLSTGADGHENRGSDFLSRYFGPAVSEPVRLHVTAKRYLCTVDPSYEATLSSASRRTLGSQGGLLHPDGVAAFTGESYAEDALALRRYDDTAKIPGAPTPTLESFAPLLVSLFTDRRHAD